MIAPIITNTASQLKLAYALQDAKTAINMARPLMIILL
jgi:hypothetical protein